LFPNTFLTLLFYFVLEHRIESNKRFTDNLMPTSSDNIMTEFGDSETVLSHVDILQAIKDYRPTNPSSTILSPLLLVGSFLMNGERRVLSETKQDKVHAPFLVPKHPILPFDLNRGIGLYKEQEMGHFALITPLIPYVNINLKQNGQRDQIVTWRSVLTALACTLTHPEESYKLLLEQVHEGPLYIVQYKERDAVKEQMFAKQCYWGRSFEAWMTGLSLTPSDIEFDAVMRRTVSNGNSNIQVLYAAEIDGQDAQGKWVELKTTNARFIPTSQKFQKWWAQSHLASIETMIVGHRDSNGHVRRIEHLSVEKLIGKEIQIEMIKCMNTCLTWMLAKALEGRKSANSNGSGESTFYKVEYLPQTRQLRMTESSGPLVLK
jgi:hypothetical protein